MFPRYEGAEPLLKSVIRIIRLIDLENLTVEELAERLQLPEGTVTRYLRMVERAGCQVGYDPVSIDIEDKFPRF